MSEKIRYLKFQGRGQRETPVGDIYMVVEVSVVIRQKHASIHVQHSSAHSSARGTAHSMALHIVLHCPLHRT